VDLTPGTGVMFTDGSRRAQVASAPTKAAFALLMQEWPRALRFDELCRRAFATLSSFAGKVSDDDAGAALAADLFGAVMYGVVGVHTRQIACVNAISEAPRACPVALADAARSDIVVNAHHAMVQLQPLDLELLKLADGTRTRDDIVRAISARMETGEFGAETTVLQAIRATELPTAVDAGLARLLRHALLAG
jgi:methyltransferase-like protein